MVSAKDFRIVYTNCFSEEKALEIGKALIHEKLAACINVVNRGHSVYQWKEIIEEDQEATLMIKTHKSKLDELEKLITDMHNYDVPEIISIELSEVSEAYLNWMREVMAV